MSRPDLDELQRRNYDHGAHPPSFDEINEIIDYARELEAQLEALKQRGLQLGGEQIARISELEAALAPFAEHFETYQDAGSEDLLDAYYRDAYRALERKS